MGVAQRIPSSVEGLPKTRAALEYARVLHAGQVRKADGAPFIVHPREVAALLYGAGAPDDVIAAGALHDVIEKTPATAFDLRRRFGSRIAALVVAVSEDQGIAGYAERKAALRDRAAAAGDEALTLFAADKISKARELRLTRPRFAPRAIRDRRRRLAHYRRSLTLLRERLPDSPLVERFAAELAELPRWSFTYARAESAEPGGESVRSPS
jgi:(p)ppGpp synthase/HD superfamily hydrolase